MVLKTLKGLAYKEVHLSGNAIDLALSRCFSLPPHYRHSSFQFTPGQAFLHGDIKALTPGMEFVAR